MSSLLETLNSEFPLLYADEALSESLLMKCYDDTHEFKTHLKKLKAHLNKHIQEAETASNLTESESLKRSKKRQLMIDKLHKSYKQWDVCIRKQSKFAVVRYGKFSKNAINRLHEFELDDVYLNKISPDSKPHINRAIGYHISRYGMGNLPVGDKDNAVQYINEVYGIEETTASTYISMGQIIQDLKNNTTDSCLEWCSNGSDLHFELYILNVMVLVKKKDVLKTYKYIKEGIPTSLFQTQSDRIVSTVSPLLTRTLLDKEIENIDKQITDQSEKCISLFSKNYCSINRLPFDSSLFLIVLSGIISFQFFIKYKAIQASLHVDWTTKDELPFDVKLPNFLSTFHPIFICPVLKEETTEENPPYSLPCHHVISRKALDKLSQNGTTSFKCPYCPVTATMSKTIKINFIML